ncbi:MAG: impJ [Solimicrobium sp.]|nr:impJ [Solimicrobium sp.]
MSEKNGVYWHQGMFLQPQHFQQADLYNKFQQKPFFETTTPHFWGIGDLELSTSAIVNRVIEVSAAKLIFRDQTYVEYPGNAVIRTRSFDANWIDGDKSFNVYLGLKKLSSDEVNVTLVASMAEARAVTTRFASLRNTHEVPDLYSDGPPGQVLTLTHVLQVFFESEINGLDDYELIPIARLVRDGESIKLSKNFIPPCFALMGSEVLMQTIKDIRDELAGRSRQLQEYKSPREMQKAEFDSSYMVFLLALRSLNRFSPYLFHLIEASQVHPWVCYGALRQLVGELSSFSERFNMLGEAEDGTPGLPAYEHADLSKCFTRAHKVIGQLLNEITVGPEFLATLEFQDGFYIAELPRSFFSDRNRFYLVVRTESSPDKVKHALLQEARLSAREEMFSLISHALPGIELILMNDAPQGLPRRSNSYYFRIEQISKQWELVEQEGLIALQWLDAPNDLKAEIVVLRS